MLIPQNFSLHIHLPMQRIPRRFILLKIQPLLQKTIRISAFQNIISEIFSQTQESLCTPSAIREITWQ